MRLDERRKFSGDANGGYRGGSLGGLWWKRLEEGIDCRNVMGKRHKWRRGMERSLNN